MTTKDCKNYIIKKLVNQTEAIARFAELNPYKLSSWSRIAKFKIGSATDDSFASTTWPEYIGCTARTFWLKDSDHITLMLVEKDNKIVAWDDISD